MENFEINQTTTGKFKAKSYDGDYMRLGKLGENVVYEWLTEHPEIIGLRNISNLIDLQTTDTDVIVILRDGGIRLAEIKTDRNLKGKFSNFFCEVLRINHKAPQEVTGTLGWTLKTEARWIMYFAPTIGYIYQFKTIDLRKCLQYYTDKRRNHTEFVWVSTDKVKSTIGILLPLRECQNNYRRHDVYDYAKSYFPEIGQTRMKLPPESIQW